MIDGRDHDPALSLLHLLRALHVADAGDAAESCDDAREVADVFRFEHKLDDGFGAVAGLGIDAAYIGK
jgi:hypothetical protein